MSQAHYPGNELELFARAENWKRYWADQLSPFLGSSVLEVGAGIGASTEAFDVASHSSWLCLEPDPELAKKVAEKIEAASLPKVCSVVIGTVQDLPTDARFDSILYIDVLEHIKDDRLELQRAAKLLRPKGTLIVLAPAHQSLFSPFDQSIGHYRRYSKQSLLALTPQGMKLRCARYLDSVGLLASLANKLILRKPLPSQQDISLWDKTMVPISRVIDPVFAYLLGKSAIAVWEAN